MLTKPCYGRLFFTVDSGNAGGNGGKSDEPPEGGKPDGNKPDGDPGGFKPITSESELAAWKGTTRKAILDEVRAELKREQDAKDAAAREEAERQAEIALGNFAKVEADLKAERDGFKTDLDTATEKLGKYAELATKRVDVLKAELPAEAVGDFPSDAEPLDQLSWLEARKELVSKLAPAVQGVGHSRVPGTPKPGNPQAEQPTSPVTAAQILY